MHRQRSTFPLSLTLLLGFPLLSVRAQELLARFDGVTGGDRLGLGLAGAGDIDGDGRADLIAGAYQADPGGTGSGAATVYSGADGSVLFQLSGAASGDEFGWAVAGVGDTDRDGHDDFAVGAWRHDGAGTDAGCVTLYSGADGSVLHERHGSGAGSYLGWSIAGAGDVDRDGYPDLVVGAHDHLTFNAADAVYVYSGCDGRLLHSFLGDRPGHTLGVCVAGPGDVDADGHDDLLIGAAFDDRVLANAGSARLYSGRTGQVLYHLDGTAPNDRFGIQCGPAGDVNGDGYADFLVGANGADGTAGQDTGRVTLYSGFDGSVLHEIEGRSAQDGMAAATGVGDMNGDGIPELLVASPAAGPGTALLLDGRHFTTLYTFVGESAGDALGRLVAAPGDTSGDGIPDLLLGAPSTDMGGSDSGQVLLFAGNDLFLQARRPAYDAGDILRLNTRGGQPSAPVLLMLTALDQVPILRPLQLSTFNVSGAYRFTATVPAGLAGRSATFVSLTADPAGPVRDSSSETVLFR